MTDIQEHHTDAGKAPKAEAQISSASMQKIQGQILSNALL